MDYKTSKSILIVYFVLKKCQRNFKIVQKITKRNKLSAQWIAKLT